MDSVNYVKIDIVTLEMAMFRMVWSSLAVAYYHIELQKLDVSTFYPLLLAFHMLSST